MIRGFIGEWIATWREGTRIKRINSLKRALLADRRLSTNKNQEVPT